MGDYRKLKCWAKAHQLALAVYRTTETFPVRERFGLVQQMRGAAISVTSNIAEGVGRNSNVETARFLRIALGSCTELECQLLLSGDLNYVDSQVVGQLLRETAEIRAMLASFHRRLRDPGPATQPHPASSDS